MSTYSQDYLNLKKFITDTLAPYTELESILESMVNGTSATYRSMHSYTTKAHVGLMHIRHKGITYQISRVSNVRNTPGYTRYVLSVYHENKLWKDEPNVAAKFFRNRWEDWFTIRMVD